MATDSVDIVGTVTTPGDPGAQAERPLGGRGSGAGETTAAPPILKCLDNLGFCTPETPGAAPVTLRDLASFRPITGMQHMQPDGWMVVGLDANFYLDSGQHDVAGSLFGQSATVRFTPVAFRWDYGDGSIATRTSGGAPWAALGIREFDPTPTSHVYRSAGSYVVRLTVVYEAAFRVGGSGFIPVGGRLTVPVNDLQITVGSATTVLVDQDCDARPDGPGC